MQHPDELCCSRFLVLQYAQYGSLYFDYVTMDIPMDWILHPLSSFARGCDLLMYVPSWCRFSCHKSAGLPGRVVYALMDLPLTANRRQKLNRLSRLQIHLLVPLDPITAICCPRRYIEYQRLLRCVEEMSQLASTLARPSLFRTRCFREAGSSRSDPSKKGK